MRAVIVAPPDDEHAVAVRAAVERLGSEVVQFSVDTFVDAPFLVDNSSTELGEIGIRFEADRGDCRGWIRRLAPPDWRRDVPPETLAGVTRTSWLALLMGVLATLPTKWLSPLERVVASENKLVQMRVARRLGIPVPRTVVASSAARIPTDLGANVVVKPLGPGDYVTHQGEARVVFAGGLSRADPRLSELHAAPFIVQERLDAAAHLRVVVVRNDVWVCQLTAAGRPLDWRAQDEAHDSFVPATGQDDVRGWACSLCAEFGIGYASQDWIVTPTGAWFIDLNPAGQWLFLPDPVASEVTEAIAKWLHGGADR